MKTTNLLLIPVLLAAFVLVGCGGSAQMAQSYKDIPVPPLSWNLPEFGEFNLENGIEGLVVTDQEVPLVNFDFLFPAPPDPVAKIGLAEMVAWTLRNGGSGKYPADQLNELLEFKGAYIGVLANQEYLEIYGFCLKNDLELLLEITSDLISNPAYPQDKLEFKRMTMLEQIRRSNDQPRGIAYREIYRLLYPNHPWGYENSVTTVSAITQEDLRAYHEQVFQPRDAVFGVAGDAQIADVKRMAQAHFGDFQNRDVETETLPQVGPTAEPAIYYGFKEVNQAYVLMGQQTISRDHPLRHAAQIMNYVLGGGGFQSILTKRIRVDQGLAYSVWSSFSIPFSVRGTFVASAATRLDNASRTLATLDEELKKYVANGPTQEQFDNAKQAYINSYVWKYENASDILERLVFLKWRDLALDTPRIDLEAYQNLTIEDVRQAARELLNPDQMIKVVIGDQSKMDKTLDNFGKVIELDLTSDQK